MDKKIELQEFQIYSLKLYLSVKVDQHCEGGMKVSKVLHSNALSQMENQFSLHIPTVHVCKIANFSITMYFCLKFANISDRRVVPWYFFS